jgi:hypothetical protein
MKYFLMFVGLVLLVSCKSYDIVQYEYRSTTMMGTRTVTITKDSVVSDYNGRMESNRIVRATLPEEWTELQLSIEKVDLKTLADLPSPTNRRQTDAAPFGSVSLSTKDSTYVSGGFDGYNADASLTPLMTIIQRIANAM